MCQRIPLRPDLLFLCIFLAPLLIGAEPVRADVHFGVPWDNAGTSGDGQVSAGETSEHLSARAGTLPGWSGTDGVAWIERTWHPGPQDVGRVAATIGDYDSAFYLSASTEGEHGGATCQAFLYLIVFENNQEISRIMTRRTFDVAMSIFPSLGTTTYQDSLIFHARSDRTYRIRAELNIEVIPYQECDNNGINCAEGNGTIDTSADIRRITLKTSNRPWASVGFQRPHGGMMRDTWNAYEKLRYVAEKRTYFPITATIELDAGGYYEGNDSYFIFSCPGDSIVEFGDDPNHFGGDLSTTPDSLVLKIPEVDTQESWTIKVTVAPEIDEVHMAACATAYPLAALWRRATGCSIAMAHLNATHDDFFNNEHWQVNDPSNGAWRPLTDAVAEGWNPDIIDPGDVSWIDPFTLLDDLPGWDQVDYEQPDNPDVVRSDIENKCRGIDPATMQFLTFPMGENSYSENRIWEVAVDMWGRGEHAATHVTDWEEQGWQVNFDYYPMDHVSVLDVPDLGSGSRLGFNVPNPFNPHTAIHFDLAKPCRVSLAVYDLAGRRIRTLIAGEDLSARAHRRHWDGTDEFGRPVAAGVYFYQLASEHFRETGRMTLVK